MEGGNDRPPRAKDAVLSEAASCLCGLIDGGRGPIAGCDGQAVVRSGGDVGRKEGEVVSVAGAGRFGSRAGGQDGDPGWGSGTDRGRASRAAVP